MVFTPKLLDSALERDLEWAEKQKFFRDPMLETRQDLDPKVRRNIKCYWTNWLTRYRPNLQA